MHSYSRIAIFSGLVLFAGPSAIVAATIPPQAACPSLAIGPVAFAVDQASPVNVRGAQSFVIAMRGGAGESYLYPYTMRVTPTGPTVTYDRSFTIDDTAFRNADAAPGAPRVADGPATQYFVFHAGSVGTTTITFDEFSHRASAAPVASKTFTVVVAENAPGCSQ